MDYDLVQLVTLAGGFLTLVVSFIYNHIVERRKSRFDMLEKISRIAVKTVEQEHKVQSESGTPLDPGVRRDMARTMIESLSRKFGVPQPDDQMVRGMIEAAVQELDPSTPD